MLGTVLAVAAGLSRLGEDEIERLCRRIDIAQGRRVDRAALRKNIAAVRRDGYVFSKHTVVRGTGIIAMLLPQGTLGRAFAIGEVVAALAPIPDVRT